MNSVNSDEGEGRSIKEFWLNTNKNENIKEESPEEKPEEKRINVADNIYKEKP